MSKSKDEIDAFLKETRIGFLTTLNADGSPNTIPLWYEWDGEKIRMFSSENTGKVRRARNDSRAVLAVAQGVGAMEDWVSVEGNVKVLSTGGKELALKLVPVYYDAERAQRTLDVWTKKDDWVLLELTPSRIRAC